jgi:hypothetical protein
MDLAASKKNSIKKGATKGGAPPPKPAPKPVATATPTPVEKTEKTDSAKAPESRGAGAETDKL